MIILNNNNKSTELVFCLVLAGAGNNVNWVFVGREGATAAELVVVQVVRISTDARPDVRDTSCNAAASVLRCRIGLRNININGSSNKNSN